MHVCLFLCMAMRIRLTCIGRPSKIECAIKIRMFSDANVQIVRIFFNNFPHSYGKLQNLMKLKTCGGYNWQPQPSSAFPVLRSCRPYFALTRWKKYLTKTSVWCHMTNSWHVAPSSWDTHLVGLDPNDPVHKEEELLRANQMADVRKAANHYLWIR